MRSVSILLLFFCCQTFAADWQPYPAELPQFDYSDSRLQEFWPQLNQGPGLPYPDETFLRDMMATYPQLAEFTLALARQPDAHPALQALLNDDLQPLATASQQVWRLHYEGRFQQAYELGKQLGPAGAIPALYSKLMYAALIVQDKDTKLATFREAAAESERLLPLAPDYAFAEFGLAYAHARILELLDTSAATATGFLGDTQDAMANLQERYPQQALYPAMLGGLHAGVVERVGSFVGRITYGSTESRALAAFSRALELQNQLPVIYNEYVNALARLDEDKYHDSMITLLQQCVKLPVLSAEEALNRQVCANHLQQWQGAE
jgi:hypothetical protein